MHHLYHTPAFVIGSRPFGEAGAEFFLLTRDFGLVAASAAGVRFLKSKLRYALSEFARIEATLVRGREGWRLTGAAKADDLYESLKGDREAVLVFGRIFRLLRRLLPGEEKNEALFAEVEGAYAFLRGRAVSKELCDGVECVLLLRILAALGYLGRRPEVDAIARSADWSDGVLALFSSVRRAALFEINRSLRESQL